MVVVVVVGGGSRPFHLSSPSPFQFPFAWVERQLRVLWYTEKKNLYVTWMGNMSAICVFFWMLNCRIKPVFDIEVFCFLIVSPALCTDWVLYRLRCFTQKCLISWIARNWFCGSMTDCKEFFYIYMFVFFTLNTNGLGDFRKIRYFWFSLETRWKYFPIKGNTLVI